MKRSAHEIWKIAKEQNLTEEQTKELMVKEGIIKKNNWVSTCDYLPQKEVKVLCYHEDSENYFISYITNDCITNDEKWFNGDLPTHWKHLDKPYNQISNKKSINDLQNESDMLRKEMYNLSKEITQHLHSVYDSKLEKFKLFDDFLLDINNYAGDTFGKLMYINHAKNVFDKRKRSN